MDVMSVYIVSLCRDTSVWTYPCKVSVLVRIVTSVHVLQDSVENYITGFSKANKKNLIELNFSRREAHIWVSGFIYTVLNFFFEQPWNNKMQIINIFCISVSNRLPKYSLTMSQPCLSAFLRILFRLVFILFFWKMKSQLR